MHVCYTLFCTAYNPEFVVTKVTLFLLSSPTSFSVFVSDFYLLILLFSVKLSFVFLIDEVQKDGNLEIFTCVRLREKKCRLFPTWGFYKILSCVYIRGKKIKSYPMRSASVRVSYVV